MEPKDPTLIVSKSRFRAEVSDLLKPLLKQTLEELRAEERDSPGFGWVDNDTAMRLLNLSRPTLARYRADGTLPYAKLGSSVYYRLSDIEAVLEARTVDRESS